MTWLKQKTHALPISTKLLRVIQLGSVLEVMLFGDSTENGKFIHGYSFHTVVCLAPPADSRLWLLVFPGISRESGF